MGGTMTTERRGDAGLEAAWRELGRKQDRVTLSIDGARIEVTDLDRRLWPSGAGVTKREFLQYLVRVGPYLLPHLSGRPVAATLCPEGVGGAAHFGGDIDRP